jgi:hypothetical protein
LLKQFAVNINKVSGWVASNPLSYTGEYDEIYAQNDIGGQIWVRNSYLPSFLSPGSLTKQTINDINLLQFEGISTSNSAQSGNGRAYVGLGSLMRREIIFNYAPEGSTGIKVSKKFNY